jgi:hypothetical protein
MKREPSNDPDILDEYDFSSGVRGKHLRQFSEGTNIVILDPDVSKIFRDSESVNEALRAMGQIIEKHSGRGPRRRRPRAAAAKSNT